MLRTINTSTTDYLRVRVKGKEDGDVVDPTVYNSYVAVVALDAVPGATDWRSAEWEADRTTTPARFWSRLLVTPGSLAVGRYAVWSRVDAFPEVPIRHAGELNVRTSS